MALREDGKIRVHHCMERIIDNYKENFYKRGGKAKEGGKDNDYYIRNALHLIGKLLVKIVFQKRRKYKELYKFEEAELVHIATISLHKAMLRFETKKSALIYFPRYMAAYIDADFKSIAKEEARYVSIDSPEYEGKEKTGETRAEEMKEITLKKIAIRAALDKLVAEGRITAENRYYFELHYSEGYTAQEIAEASKITLKGIQRRVFKVKSRVKEEIMGDGVDKMLHALIKKQA
jgi:DNA-directed RNA polymerase specialized sigma24 family protein